MSELGELLRSPGTTMHEYEGSKERQQLNDALASAWYSGKYSDVTIKTRGEDIKCHMIILSQCVKLCEDIPDDQADITISLNFDENIVRLVLDFLYLNKVSVPEVDIPAVAKLADHLGVSELHFKCKTTELSLKTLSIENCLEMWADAKCINNQDILDKACTFALENFAKVKRTDQFLSLPMNLLKDYLCHDKLKVQTQEERLGAALNRMRRASAGQIGNFRPLLCALPMHVMSRWYLEQTLDDPLIQSMPEICQKINEVLEG